MRKMKDSGVEWIGEIPEDWEITRLKNICHGFFNGSSVLQVDENINSQKITRIETISKGYIDYKKVGYVNNCPKEYRLKKYDFLVSNINSISKLGNSAMIKDNTEIYHGMNLIRITPDKVYFKFLYYFIKSDAFIIAMQVNCKPAINQASVPSSYIKVIKVPFPKTTKEQEKIALYLDDKCNKIDSTIEKEKEQIEKLKEYKTALITEKVTKGLDENVKMKDSGIEWIGAIPNHWKIEKIKYLMQKNINNNICLNADDEIGYVPMECIKQGYMLPKSILYKNTNSGLTYFEDGDIVLAKVTPCFENGNIAIAKKLKNNIAFGSSELFVFKFINVNVKFMFYFLQNSIFRENAISTMTGTGGLKRVSADFISNYFIMMPPTAEQQQIADYLDDKCNAIDSAIKRKEELIEKLNEYKKSLIYEVVTGKKEI